MSTALKLALAWCLLVGSVLLLRVDGWFGVGFVLALPLIILYWFDLGRELRASQSSSRWHRAAGLIMGLPQALFGIACAAIGIAIICWVLYNSFFERDPNYTGSFLTLGIGPVLTLFGIGLAVDAFSRGSSQDA